MLCRIPCILVITDLIYSLVVLETSADLFFVWYKSSDLYVLLIFCFYKQGIISSVKVDTSKLFYYFAEKQIISFHQLASLFYFT